MKLSFHGAARSVTGSRHMLEVPGFRLLLDLAYVHAIQPSPSKVILVHGEEKQALSLALAIQSEHPRIEVTGFPCRFDP